MNTHEAQSALRQLINHNRALKYGEELFDRLGKAEGETAELRHTIAEQQETIDNLAAEHDIEAARFKNAQRRMQDEHEELAGQLATRQAEFSLAVTDHKTALQAATNAERDRREALVQELHQAEATLRDEITQLAQARDELDKELASIRARFA